MKSKDLNEDDLDDDLKDVDAEDAKHLLTNVNFETLSTLHKTQLTLNLNHHIIDSKEIFSFCFLRPRSPRRSFV